MKPEKSCPHFTFMYSEDAWSGGPATKITYEVSSEVISRDALQEEFNNFLRGCGFHIEEEES